jgi:nucleoside-diphosphate-sugar epimerase
MKVLFIGGTGNISTSVSKLAVAKGMDIYLLNRGNRQSIPGTKSIIGDITTDTTHDLLKSEKWDVVVNWIAFLESDVKRDIELFSEKTGQYVFISSASAYQKPLAHPVVTESTPVANPFWEYSRNKIDCEERLIHEYRKNGFPVTIVRPSHTYDTLIPVAIGGWEEYNIIERLKQGRKIIVHGDGTSLWTLTHSEDFAKGFIGLLGHQQAIGHTFHITSDEVLNWNQIYEAVADAAGVKPNIIHIPSDFIARYDAFQVGNLLGDKSYSVIFDNTKIKTFVPGFTATIPFKEGIKRTLGWYEENPGKKVINPETDRLMDRIIQAYEKN